MSGVTVVQEGWTSNSHKNCPTMTTSDVAAPSSNTAAVVTYTAGGAGNYHVISGVAWSYSGTPTGGNLIIQDGSNTIFNIDITSAGPGFIPFDANKAGSVNTALTVTLAAAGSGVFGKASVLGHWITST